jgi:DNA-binding transcriptional LysR family regulator
LRYHAQQQSHENRLRRVSEQSHFRYLEEQLEVKLFRRTTRKVMLTEQGERLVQTMSPHLNSLRESLLASHKQANSLSGIVKVSVSHAYGRVILLPQLAKFKQLHPEVVLQVSLADGIDDLLDKQIDLTIRLGPLPDSALVARSLGSADVVLVGATSLLSAHVAPKSITQLDAWPTIAFRVPGNDQPYNWVFRIPVNLCFTDRALMPARTRALIEFLVSSSL